MLFAQSKAKKNSRNLPAYTIPSDSVYLDISLQRPPSYSIDNKKTHVGGGSTASSVSGSGTYAKQWLVTEITFSFNVPSNLKVARTVSFNDLRIELFLAVPSVTANSKGRYETSWFYGSQVLHSVVVDPTKKEQKYMASLFMPPSYVYMFFPRDDKTEKYNLKTLEGVILFFDKDGVLIGGKAFEYKNKPTKARDAQLLEYVDQLRKSQKMPIMLWPREKTPWHWLDADRFELPKTEFPASPAVAGENEDQGGAE